MAVQQLFLCFVSQVACALSVQLPSSVADSTQHLDPVLVSVIVPTCNRDAFLVSALGQLASQDYPRIEVVVVDDGRQPAQEYLRDMITRGATSNSDGDISFLYPRGDSDMLVHLLRLNTPTSIGEKRNLAVRVAKGDIIMHWDDDDWFAPNRISTQVAPILQGKTLMTVLEHKYFFEFASQSFLEHNEMHRLPNGEVVRYNDFFSKGHGALFLGTLAYERDVFDLVGGYERVSRGEDIRFIEAALTHCAPLLNVRDVANVYIRHNNTPAGAHNTWVFNKLEQHLMYDYVHRVSVPAFVSDSMMTQHLRAEARANEQGRCEAPSGAETQFTVKYFPEMPSQCCNGVANPNQGLGCETSISGDVFGQGGDEHTLAEHGGELVKDLSEAGYQAAASNKQSDSLRSFVMKMLERDGFEVVDWAAFQAFLAERSGASAARSVDELVVSLNGAPFIARKTGMQK